MKFTTRTGSYGRQSHRDDRVPRGRRGDADDGRRRGGVERDVVAVLRGADDVLRRRRGHDRGDVALLRRRARAVRVHRWDFLAHDARVAALGEAIERLLDLHGRGSIRAMISGWSSKASEAELKGAEGGD